MSEVAKDAGRDLVLFGLLAPNELFCCSLDLYKYLNFALFLTVPLKFFKGFRV